MAGTILADIGGGTTDIQYLKMEVSGIRSRTRGRLSNDPDIAIGLGLPFEVAEEMKKKYGTALPVYEGKAGTNDSIAQNGHNISYQGVRYYPRQNGRIFKTHRPGITAWRTGSVSTWRTGAYRWKLQPGGH